MSDQSGNQRSPKVWVPLLLACATGVVVAQFGPLAALPVAGGVALLIALLVPLPWLVMSAWAIAALLAGTVEYFLGFSQFFWLPPAVGVLAGSLAVIQSSTLKQTETQEARTSGVHRWLMVLLLLWFSVALFSSAVARTSLPQLLVATKNYLFPWGFALAALLPAWPAPARKRFWSAIVVTALLQWPFVLYQRLVIVPRRHDHAAWDAIVGSFGGSPDGGGHSAAMALVACIAVAVVATRWHRKEISSPTALTLGLLCLAPAMLAEVKMIFVWLAGLLAIVGVARFRRHPSSTLVGALVGVVLLAGSAVAYKAFMYEGQGGMSWVRFYDAQIKYAVDPNEFSVAQRRLGRTASLKFWWQQNSTDDPVGFLIGNGLGSSRGSSSLAVGDVARRYPYEIDTSTATVLLWDTGLLGAALYFSLLAVAVLSVLARMASGSIPPAWRDDLPIISAVLALVTLGFIYNRDAIDTPAIQMLVAMCWGWLLRALKSSGEAPS